VGRQEHRLAEFAQREDGRPRAAPGGGIEAGRRLVKEDQVGVADQRERQVEATALPTPEILGPDIGASRRDPPARSARQRKRRRV
jgi:hypothetical protein